MHERLAETKQQHTNVVLTLGKHVRELHDRNNGSTDHAIAADHNLAILETHLQLAYLFHAWDSDFDGVLSLMELISGLHLAQVKVSRRRYVRMYKSLTCTTTD